jgi:hypothetical protein
MEADHEKLQNVLLNSWTRTPHNGNDNIQPDDFEIVEGRKDR